MFQRLCLLLIVLVVAAAAPATTVLVQDDFNDDSIDSSKWSTNTDALSNNIAGAAVVEETGGSIHFVNRGHLNTANSYDPVALGGLIITGTWTFQDSDDFMQILTRSSGVPGGSFGETTIGIEARANANDDAISFNGRGGFGITTTSRTGTFSAAAGDVFDFVFIDTGSELSFKVTNVNTLAVAKITGIVTSTVASANLVTFHNREGGTSGGVVNHDRDSLLDNVTITAIPAPAALPAGLMLLGGLLMRRRQK